MAKYRVIRSIEVEVNEVPEHSHVAAINKAYELWRMENNPATIELHNELARHNNILTIELMED